MNILAFKDLGRHAELKLKSDLCWPPVSVGQIRYLKTDTKNCLATAT